MNNSESTLLNGIEYLYVCRSKHTYKSIWGILSVILHISSEQATVNTNYKLPIINLRYVKYHQYFLI